MVDSSRSEQIEKAFQEANAFMRDPNVPAFNSTNAQKLQFYGLFKQATVGECNGK